MLRSHIARLLLRPSFASISTTRTCQAIYNAKQKHQDTSEHGFMVDHIRSRLSPSYFTGRSMYIDNMYSLQKLLKTHKSALDKLVAEREEIGQPLQSDGKQQWITKNLLEDAWNLKLSAKEYEDLTGVLDKLALLETAVSDVALRQALTRFRSVQQQMHSGDTKKHLLPRGQALDENGCAYAIGYRRRVRAHVWMSEAVEPGEGRVMIDGKDYVQVLKRQVIRCSCVSN